MSQAGVSPNSDRSRRVQAWLDWTEDEMWIAPPSRRSAKADARRRGLRTDRNDLEGRASRPVVRRDRISDAAPARRDRISDAAPPRRDRPATVAASRADRAVAAVAAPARPVRREATGDAPPTGRRTVMITGHGDDRRTGRAQVDARPRPEWRRHERPGYRPDRTALYAVLLGLVLVLVAATSSHAATVSPAHARPAAKFVTVAPMARR